jgi:hypothetical protein
MAKLAKVLAAHSSRAMSRMCSRRWSLSATLRARCLVAIVVASR